MARKSQVLSLEVAVQIAEVETATSEVQDQIQLKDRARAELVEVRAEQAGVKAEMAGVRHALDEAIQQVQGQPQEKAQLQEGVVELRAEKTGLEASIREERTALAEVRTQVQISRRDKAEIDTVAKASGRALAQAQYGLSGVTETIRIKRGEKGITLNKLIEAGYVSAQKLRNTETNAMQWRMCPADIEAFHRDLLMTSPIKEEFSIHQSTALSLLKAAKVHPLRLIGQPSGSVWLRGEVEHLLVRR